MRPRHVLVTGGAGYIGAPLVGALLQAGYHVRVLDRFMFGGESLLGSIHNKALSVLSGDIRCSKIVEESLTDVDTVIHLAALVGDPACGENPRVARDVNLLASVNLAKAARKRGGTRFVMTSTCSGYGVSSGSEEATEGTRLNPLSLYAETKVAAERAVLALKSASFHPTVVRLATIFGLAPRMRFNLMVNEFAKEAAVGGRISVVNMDSWRPFLHVTDAADAYLTVISADLPDVSGQIFNVVSENVQKRYLADLTVQMNPKVTVESREGGLGNKRDYRVSASKIRETLSFTPRLTVRDGFVEMVRAVEQGVFLDVDEYRWNGWSDRRCL